MIRYGRTGNGLAVEVVSRIVNLMQIDPGSQVRIRWTHNLAGQPLKTPQYGVVSIKHLRGDPAEIDAAINAAPVEA